MPENSTVSVTMKKAGTEISGEQYHVANYRGCKIIVVICPLSVFIIA
jgi:hypothetical protein